MLFSVMVIIYSFQNQKYPKHEPNFFLKTFNQKKDNGNYYYYSFIAHYITLENKWVASENLPQRFNAIKGF
jgi:hypothetical protein